MTAQRKENNNRPTVLYRFWDSQSRLLYVGISSNAPSRWKNHRNTKDWWPEVKFSAMQHFDTREQAEKAESLAIQNERPLYNIIHNNRATKKDGPKEYRFFYREMLDSVLPFPSSEHEKVPLWLYYELDGSTYVEDEFDHLPEELRGKAQFDLFISYVKKNHPEWWEEDEVPVYWGIEGPYKFERAPYLCDDLNFPDLRNHGHSHWLKWFTWPIDDNDEPLNWFDLEVKSDRLPFLHEYLISIGWRPTPLRRTCPLKTLYQNQKYRLAGAYETKLWLEKFEERKKTES